MREVMYLSDETVQYGRELRPKTVLIELRASVRHVLLLDLTGPFVAGTRGQ